MYVTSASWKSQTFCVHFQQTKVLKKSYSCLPISDQTQSAVAVEHSDYVSADG